MDDMADEFWPFFVALFWICLALITFGLIGPIALAVTGYLIATNEGFPKKRIRINRVRRILGLDSPQLTPLHAGGLIGGQALLAIAAVAMNICLSLLTVGIRGEEGAGDTGVSNVCIGILLANLLISIPVILATWLILILRAFDFEHWELFFRRQSSSADPITRTRIVLVGSLGGVFYGIAVGIIGNQLIGEYLTPFGELIRDLPGVIAASICLLIAVHFARQGATEWPIYLGAPVALSSAAIAFDSLGVLEGNFGVVALTGWIIVICSATAFAITILSQRHQLLWSPSLHRSDQAVVAWVCTISLLAALWRSNPYSIGALLAALGPAYVSVKKDSRVVTAMTVGSLSAIFLRYTAVAIDGVNFSWDPLGLIFLLVATSTGFMMIRKSHATEGSPSLIRKSPAAAFDPVRITRRNHQRTNASAAGPASKSIHSPRVVGGAETEPNSDASSTAGRRVQEPLSHADSTNLETLICSECDSEWSRTRTRGRKPRKCPSCKG